MRLLSMVALLLIFTGFIMFSNNERYHPSKAEQLVNSTLAKTAQIIKKKYKIQPSGEGASMPGGPIQELSLCFDTKDQLTKESLRELLIKLAHELLSQIITNEDIQQYLKELPFTIKNIQIIIYNKDQNGREVYDPEILTAEISEGVLTYRTINQSFKLKNQFEESYEEALKALTEQ